MMPVLYSHCTLYLSLLAALLLCAAPLSAEETESASAMEALNEWLAQAPDEREPLQELPFAEAALTREDAEEAATLLWEDWLAQNRETHEAIWQDQELQHDDVTMRFDYRTYGDKPEAGRSLYISLHGGGGTAPEVNDAQWRNQIELYEPEEGLYVAPRAPTNDWNLWHKAHIDPLFDRLIASAVAHKDVDPNRVYVMGYSAGGDGVYQLAPRMADRWAAAAMMAGHPNNASPENLRNIGFTLHMGGQDAAYDRNEVAEEWKERLAELQEDDPEGYPHEVVIYPEHGHWMQGDDAQALDWMKEFTRNPYPERVVWRQDNVTHPRLYWVGMPPAYREEGARVTVERDGATFRILETENVDSITLLWNDDFADLDEPLRVLGPDEAVLFEGEVSRTLATLAESLAERPDPAYLFTASVSVDVSSGGTAND
ncbi:MAG: dienelactone hydrolase family protein [Candidatus Hydrogenedentota bacterium]